MNPSVPSVDQLKELALPVPVSYLPQTWGWIALLLIIVVGLALWAALGYWRWRQDRYRRDALARLAELERTMDSDPVRTLREVPELLKRVALSMPGQPSVATLSGSAWQEFLANHSREKLPADFSEQLAGLAYGPDAQLRALSIAQRQQLLSQCKRWVEHHHVAA